MIQVFRIYKPIHVHMKSWPKFVTHPFRIIDFFLDLNVICSISRNTDHWSYINIFIKFHFNFLNLFYQFINITGRFLHVFNTFYIFFPAVLPEVQQRGSHAKGRWLQRLAHNIPVVEESLVIHTSFLQNFTEQGKERQFSLLIRRKSAFCLPPVSYSRNLTACYGN